MFYSKKYMIEREVMINEKQERNTRNYSKE